MPASFVQSKGATGASGTSLAVQLTGVASGNHIATGAGGFVGSASAPVFTLTTSDQAGTWRNAINQPNANYAANSSQELNVDYVENTGSGTWNITVHATNSTTGIASAAVESTGVKTASSIGVTAKHTTGGLGNATATTQAGSATPAAGSIMLAFMADDGGQTAQAGIDAGGQTGAFNPTPAGGTSTCWDGANQRTGAAYHNNVSAVATNPTWTESAAQTWCVGIVEFLASAGVQEPTFGMRQPIQGMGGLPGW